MEGGLNWNKYGNWVVTFTALGDNVIGSAHKGGPGFNEGKEGAR